MNTRKRQAADPLLPFHASKQRRIRMVGYDGGNPSPSQDTGLLARWVTFGRLFKELGSDTVKAIIYGQQDTFQTLSLPAHDTAGDCIEDYNPACTPSKTGASNPTNFMADAANNDEPTLLHPPSLKQNAALHSRRSHRVTTPSPSTAHAGTSTPYTNTTRPSPRKNEDGFIPRKYRNREHIFAKEHKAHVQAENQRWREEMQRDIYNIKRHHGYTSNFTEFQSLLAFQAKLEKIDQRDVLSPSSSMSDLHSKDRAPSQRRHSYSDDYEIAFLRRALDNARATLNEPRPPQPFQPSLDQLRLSHRAKDKDIEQLLRPKPTPPTPLPPDADSQVNLILNKRGVVSKFAREQVNDQDLSRLKPSQWLNDEIVNFYGAMILARSEGCKENPVQPSKTNNRILNVHYFNTFFWLKLKEGYDKSRLAKWTKKVDIFSKDVILIPINHSNAHWTSAAINFRRKRIESYDSMGMRRDIVFQYLRSYLDSEHRNKKKRPFDFTGWEDHSLEEPLQENGYDCGVFTCQFLQGLSRGDEFVRFTQKDMPSLRRRMIWEIGNATLREDP